MPLNAPHANKQPPILIFDSPMAMHDAGVVYDRNIAILPINLNRETFCNLAQLFNLVIRNI